jgi:soluble lytic murein transglycosylase-like protein
MLYEEKVKTNREAFIAKVITISQKLGIEPEWLMQVFVNESGMNHQAVNSTSNATGLIQFMPDTAVTLGTSVAAPHMPLPKSLYKKQPRRLLKSATGMVYRKYFLITQSLQSRLPVW